MTRLPVTTILAITAIGASAHGVAPQAVSGGLRFDVASVRPSPDPQRFSRSFDPGRFRATGHSLALLVSMACEIELERIVVPEHLRRLLAGRFDIEATTSPGTTRPQVFEMLAGLLEDRFAMKARREVHSMPVFALVRLRDDGRLGPQLQQVQRDCATPENGGRCSRIEAPGRWIMRGATWERIGLPRLTAAYVGAHVVERIGLSGQFDMQLEWQEGPPRLPDDQDPRPASFEGVLREQLGLGLERIREDVDVLVIEQVSMPSPN